MNGANLSTPTANRAASLVGIKLLHTAVWVFFSGCIMAIPLAGARRQFSRAAILSGLVLTEGTVLVINRGRCPLTDLAARYTSRRDDNFDIYLPISMARHTKPVCTALFALGELYVLAQRTRERTASND